MSYTALKHIHTLLAFTTIIFFFIRGFWLFMESDMIQKKWVRISPHVIDTSLLLLGLVLAGMIKLSPAQNPWFTEKMIAVVIYIFLGIMTFRLFRKGKKSAAIVCFILAAACFGYVLTMAFTKNAMFIGLPS